MDDEGKSMQNKYNAMHKGTSTIQLRHKIKERFMNTLQEVRRKRIDARRFSNPSDSANETKIFSMKDLLDILVDNKDFKELMSSEETDQIFKKIQEEIGWKNEDEIDLYDAEIQAVVENLLTYCAICEQSSEKIVCESCGNEHFSESL